MKCFYNPSEDAVGTCKSCGRALSPAYLTEYPKALACKGRCEQDVEALVALIENNITISKASTSLVRSSSSGFYASFLLYLVMGGAFLWMGSRKEINVIFFLGIAFLLFAFYVLFRGLKVSRTLRAAGR